MDEEEGDADAEMESALEDGDTAEHMRMEVEESGSHVDRASVSRPIRADIFSDEEDPVENEQQAANESHLSGQTDEGLENANLLRDLEGDPLDIAASDPSNFDFEVELPEFRPYNVDDAFKSPTHLCIKAISTENFKSYYGKKILGPFDQKFTAIIGPNGCGKSNTIDALLFVFGFRSSKLRTHKLPELIHNSEELNNCTSAKVTVHFAVMGADKLPLEDVETSQKVSEFDIGRSINKQNKSDYFLNGARSTQQAIIAKLRQHGVDLDHNRFLILQGEVEQISLMKPTSKTDHEEGMLGYLEDIIGSNRYKVPIEKFDEIIRLCESDLVDSETVHHRLQQDLVSMNGAKLKAERYLERDGELHRVHHICIQNRLYKLQRYLKEAILRETSSKVELEKAKQHVTELRVQEESWKSAQGEFSKNVKELKSRITAATAVCVECESKKAAVDADLKSRGTMLKRLEGEVKKLRDSSKELQGQQKNDAARKAELEECLPALDEKVREYTDMFLVAQNEVASVTKEYQVKKSDLEKTKTTAVTDQQLASRKLDSKTLELNSVRKDAIAAEQRLTGLQKTLEKVQQEIVLLEGQQETDNSRLQDVRVAMDAHTITVAKLTTQKNDLQAKARSKNERLIALKETNRSASIAVTRDAAIQELMRCKANGSIPGIYGRVGDLGGIDKKYEIAISFVAGASLDRVVVDCVATSKACVEHLRRTGKGKANLIVLDQIRDNACMRYMDGRNFPEGLPRLFDLVTVEDPELRPIFYYTLRDSLVAENMDQALRVGRTQKVVTLRGDVVDPSGAMSGGGNPGNIEIRIGRNVVSHSSQAGTFNQADITKIEKEMEKLQGDLQTATVEHGSITLELSNLKREHDGLIARLASATKNLQMSSKLAQSLPADVEKAEKRVAELKKFSLEETRMNKNIEELKKSLEKLTKAVDKLSGQIADVDKEIWDVREEKVRDSEKKLKKWQAKLDEVQKELRDLSASVAGDGGAVTNREALIKKKEGQIEDVKAKITELQKKQKEFEMELTSTNGAAGKLTEELSDIHTSFNHLRVQLAKIEEDIEAAESAVATCVAEVQAAQKDMHDFDLKVSEVEPRLDKIIQEAEGIERKFAKPVIFVCYSPLDLERMDMDKIKKDYRDLRTWKDNAKVNLGVLKEYDQARRTYDEHLKEYQAIRAKFAAAQTVQKRLIAHRTEEFLASFEIIQEKLKTTYRYLTHGGDADLVAVNRSDIFGDGIEFSVRPPNKSWKSISNLSGGEKTLSSLSLIFALHHYKPTPFYIMDEIDAALDYRNVSIVGKYVKDRALDAQFIIISLRPNMYQQASRHIGIFKVNSVTQVALLPKEAYEGWIPSLSNKKKTKNTAKDGNLTDEQQLVKRKYLAAVFPKP